LAENTSAGVPSGERLRGHTTRVQRGRLAVRQRLIAYGLIAPSFLIILGVMAYPMVYTTFLSFHTRILSRPALGTRFVGLANYLQAIQDPLFLQVFGQTLYFVVASLAIELVVGLGLALLLHRTFCGRNLVRGFILLPWMLSPVVAAFSWAWLLNDAYGLVNYLLVQLGVLQTPRSWLGTVGVAMPVVILVDAWREIPFVTVVLLAGLQSIPSEVREAARVDGASSIRAFFHVTLPLLKPSILIALLMRTMMAVRLFELVFVMTKGGPASSTEVLATYTYREAFLNFNMGYASSLAVVILLVSLAISLVYIRTMYSEGHLR
jgi:ABC-type sugar transport system permease subunit